ncbi:hypothetical protein BS50DRAFT_501897 [Corynespora cassiicola Philippines]|uniref:ELYS-like domain-containing protein n=1 Tax=Corynespora cassiicola Philippines TaxID=1448308 RepID=A0A2T2NBD3_CORCC|nr:hypothetical protein BS50DRAFT_501897 [Corynespora cassiicola Philippines]
MIDVEDFESVFPIGYPSAVVENIRRNQQMLGGKTFFERLLETLHIKCELPYLHPWRKIYPPESDEKLLELHKRIIDAPITLHYKHCLFFYLLKDLSPSYHEEETELATAFASNIHLEKRFWTFIEGIWALDHRQYETAVGQLTHPSIIPTFPDEIMLALLKKVEDDPGKPSEEILPLAYYNCAKPPLVGETVKKDFVKYMADRNVTETYYWIRARPEYEHKALLEILIEETLERRHWRGQDEEVEYSREDKAMELVSLPFDEDEEKWIESFLTEGKGRNFKGAADTVLMRKIATGRLQEVAKDTSRGGKRLDGVNWDVLRDGVKKGLGPRKDEETFAV